MILGPGSNWLKIMKLSQTKSRFVHSLILNFENAQKFKVCFKLLQVRDIFKKDLIQKKNITDLGIYVSFSL